MSRRRRIDLIFYGLMCVCGGRSALFVCCDISDFIFFFFWEDGYGHGGYDLLGGERCIICIADVMLCIWKDSLNVNTPISCIESCNFVCWHVSS